MGLKLTGHGNVFSKAKNKVESTAKKATPYLAAGAGFVIGAAVGGPAGAAIGAGMGFSMGSQMQQAYYQNKYNQESLRLQQQAYADQSAELQRQRQIEIEQRKRENQQLMNAVTDLSNVSYGGQSSPSVSYDKYGDLG